MTLTEKRKLIGTWLREEDGGALWDLMCGLRGPDSPSERPDQSPSAQASNYKLRRDRKRATVEVIRERAFFGVVGGGARHHDADEVELPPSKEWDHFDGHVVRAANVVGLKIKIRGEK